VGFIGALWGRKELVLIRYNVATPTFHLPAPKVMPDDAISCENSKLRSTSRAARNPVRSSFIGRA
jgi:hypothetical protein